MSKFSAIASTFFLFLAFAAATDSEKLPFHSIFEVKSEYALPPLSYELDALEPYLQESTMKAHYLGHHESYKNKMNNFLKQWRQEHQDTLSNKTLFEILNYIEDVPQDLKTSITNNAGGYVNHALYWSIMSPNEGDAMRTPSGELLDLIANNFGSFLAFKEKFTADALSLFGSGYVWLVFTNNTEQLKIVSTANQDCPISHNQFPILVIDVWEHAYYLQHQYKRPDHLQDFWHLVDWDNVETLRKFLVNYLVDYVAYTKEEL